MGVGLGRNTEVTVVPLEGGWRGELSGWVGMNEKETSVGWYTVLVFGPGRW